MESVNAMNLRRAINKIIFNAKTVQEIENNCDQVISITEDIVKYVKTNAEELLITANNIINELETWNKKHGIQKNTHRSTSSFEQVPTEELPTTDHGCDRE